VLSVPRGLARLEVGVGVSGVHINLEIPKRLPMSLNDSPSDSSSMLDLARESKNTSIMALTGLATPVSRDLLGEDNGERNGGREGFAIVLSGRKGARLVPGEDTSALT
jgi:hypothetical protein